MFAVSVVGVCLFSAWAASLRRYIAGMRMALECSRGGRHVRAGFAELEGTMIDAAETICPLLHLGKGAVIVPRVSVEHSIGLAQAA